MFSFHLPFNANNYEVDFICRLGDILLLELKWYYCE